MPEYLAPGVYVEETSFRAKSIEGVSTSTAGCVGPTRFGPLKGIPELVTNFGEFERIYGGMDPLEYSAGPMINFMAQGVRAFFEEGGKRLYVARAYLAGTTDGIAKATLASGSPPSGAITLAARHPGDEGNGPVSLTFKASPNVLSSEFVDPSNTALGQYLVLRGAVGGDVVWVRTHASAITSPPGAGTIYWLERIYDATNQRYTFRLRRDNPTATPAVSVALETLASGDEVRILSVNVTVKSQAWQGVGFHPGKAKSLSQLFTTTPTSRATTLYNPLTVTTAMAHGAAIAEALLGQANPIPTNTTRTFLDTVLNDSLGDGARTLLVTLAGGSDGQRPNANEYAGADGALDGLKSGLSSFEDIDDISIVFAPGSSFNYKSGYKTAAETIVRLLISHCERMRYRVAVLDSAEGQLLSEVRAYRGQLDSKHAALYYPWVTIADPVTGQEISLPPSGFVAGIYARNDVEKGVHKAPANEVVRLAIDLEYRLNKGQQDVLNPEGIDCLRYLEGRGFRVWGARTISSDPEWKYVNVRRYFAFLEHSIDKGTQWAVFENNGDALWANVRRTIEDFLYNEWNSGRLLGLKPEEAFFVRCDRSTMTQNDLDNGRLICLVGVSVLKPAEFVIFRIGQWTADRKS